MEEQICQCYILLRISTLQNYSVTELLNTINKQSIHPDALLRLWLAATCNSCLKHATYWCMCKCYVTESFFWLPAFNAFFYDVTIWTCLHNLYHVILLSSIAEFLKMFIECIDGNKILLTYLLTYLLTFFAAFRHFANIKFLNWFVTVYQQVYNNQPIFDLILSLPDMRICVNFSTVFYDTLVAKGLIDLHMYIKYIRLLIKNKLLIK